MFDDLDRFANTVSRWAWRFAAKQTKKAARDFKAARNIRQVTPLLRDEFPLDMAQDIIRDLGNGADPDQVVAHYRQALKQRRNLVDPPPIHGASRWAGRQDFDAPHTGGLKRTTIFDTLYTDEGLFLGGLAIPDPTTRELPDNWLNWNGEGHITTLAPTGSGKSRYLLIPNLLRYGGSCVVFDVKAELYNATSDYRRTLGPVYKISPFDEATHAFNPLATVETVDDGRALAELLLPRTAAGDARFYDDESINFLGAYILFIAQLVYPEHKRTLDELRERTAVTTETLRADLEKLTADDMPKAIRRAARVALTKSMDKGLPSLIQSLNQHLAVWDNDGLMAATANPPDFDFRGLKTRTATVYITLPLDKLDAYRPFAKLVLASALASMVKNPVRPAQPVLFVLDEFLTLGSFPALANALRTHRDAGVRLWYLLQDLASLKEAYPKNWETFFTQASVRTYFGTHDLIDAEYVSKQTGMTTIAYESASVSGSVTGSTEVDREPSATFSQSTGVQYAGRPVATPDGVIQMLGRENHPGERLAISRINGVPYPVPHVLAAWDLGEFGLGRFGSPAYTFHSDLLAQLFDDLNARAFGGTQPPLSFIAYQDFSMGRDGGTAFHKFMGLYKVPFDAIVLAAKYMKVEFKIAKLGDAPETDETNALIAMCLEFLRRLVLHEMIHRETIRRTGNPEYGHGPVFVEVCNEALARAGPICPYQPATSNNAPEWPGLPMAKAVHELCAIENPNDETLQGSS